MMKKGFDKEKIDFGGRTWLFKALVGSHNYNMNTAESDKDYKLFVVPTFEDLYFNNQFSHLYLSDTEDIDVHDIRKLTSLLYKSNVNFTEILFSKEIIINEDLCDETKDLLSQIFLMKDKLATMNLSYLYKACTGMHLTKKKQVEKGTEGTQHLVDAFGYDTKQSMHSFRILDFLIRFANNNFKDFEKAIWYEDNDPMKKFLLDVKQGQYSKESYYEMADIWLENLDNKIKPLYLNYELDTETNDKLLEKTKEIVKIELF